MSAGGGDDPIRADESALTVRDSRGEEVSLTPWLEDANAEGFDAAFFDELMDAKADLLADEVLAQGEPTYERVAKMLPRVVDVTFVGDPRRDERFLVEPDGRVEGLSGPLAEISPEELARQGRWGIIDRRLPLPVLRIEQPYGPPLEQITVPALDDRGSPDVLVRRQIGGQVCYESARRLVDPGAERFSDALLTHRRMVEDFYAAGASISAGEGLLNDLACSSLWLASLTMRGCHPRYGIGTYDRFKDHGFPPTVIHLGFCLLDWGHFERARDVIDCYLNAYVADEGTFIYYGPALAEYGQFLSLCGRFAELTGDRRWWLQRESVLRRIWNRLLTLRSGSLADQDAPPHARGMIPGLPEADYHGDEKQWREYYYSGDAWTIRGLSDVARALRAGGNDAEADHIEYEVKAYRGDLLDSVAAVTCEVQGETFVPPGPTQTAPIERMTQDRHSSYCNYRYFAEMVSAGVLPQRAVRHILAWRRAHGGELLAMTRFEDHLDDWPVLNWARAMLDTGEIERYQLLLHAHLAHHHAAGWLASPEQAKIVPDPSGVRRFHAGQVVPSQVTLPQMLRWALLYEPRDAEMLLVAPAAQSGWLEQGITAEGLPTRWGSVDLSMHEAEGAIEVELLLPANVPEVGVRLPLRPGLTLQRADIEGGLMLETADDEVFVRPESERLRIIGTLR